MKKINDLFESTRLEESNLRNVQGGHAGTFYSADGGTATDHVLFILENGDGFIDIHDDFIENSGWA